MDLDMDIGGFISGGLKWNLEKDHVTIYERSVCVPIYTRAHTTKEEVKLTFCQHPLNHSAEDARCTLAVRVSDLKECGSAVVLGVWDLSRKIKIGGIRGIIQGYYKYLSVVGR